MRNWEADDPDETETPWWGTLWVPFAGRDGDDHFLDAGPGLWCGRLGYAAHGDDHFLGWPSLGAWLHAVADTMLHHDDPDHAAQLHRPVLRRDGTLEW
ncbi:hypothetical protein AB0C76_18335 [Kitasatospora sp. NPDC048722]|uniref:hypothetical protein n=1 Tax=Kitasatospora sp. NPDC048722 TaxID=3155639 RepID=UPI0033CAD9A6